MEQTAQQHAERANEHFRGQKAIAVMHAGEPVDAIAIMEVWVDGKMIVVVIDREHIGRFCSVVGIEHGLADAQGEVEAIVYSSDAWRREFGPDGPIEDTRQEVLTTLCVTADGGVGSVVTPYTYDPYGAVVFGVPEVHAMLDSTVAEDMRKAFG